MNMNGWSLHPMAFGVLIGTLSYHAYASGAYYMLWGILVCGLIQLWHENRSLWR